MSFFLIVIVEFVVISVIAFLSSQRKSSIDKATMRLSRSVGLDVHPELANWIHARVRIKARGRLIGSIAAPTVGLAAVAIIGSFSPVTSSLLPIGLYIIGMNIGGAVGAVVGELRLQEASLRVARPRAVTLTDYVPKIVQIITPVLLVTVIAVSVPSLIRLAGVSPSRYASRYLAGDLTSIWGLAATAVLGVAVWLVGGVLVMRRAQPASSPRELAWDDAFRADCLYSLAVTASIGPVYLLLGTFFAVDFAGNSSTAAASQLQPYLWLLLAAGVVASIAIVAELIRAPQRQYLRRLWPEVERERKNAGQLGPQYKAREAR